jgi:hypothetical protein
MQPVRKGVLRVNAIVAADFRDNSMVSAVGIIASDNLVANQRRQHVILTGSFYLRGSANNHVAHFCEKPNIIDDGFNFVR